MDNRKAIAVYLTLFLLTSCSMKPGEQASGQQLFEYYCKHCHGAEGTGNILIGTPANVMTEKTVPRIINQIKRGSPSHAMPPIELPSTRQAEKIAIYLLQLKREFIRNNKSSDLLLLPADE